MQEQNLQHIYIVLSRTQTAVARVLRTFGRLEYNHVAISLDRDFTELYSFARSEQYGFLTGRLVHETTDRYLVNSKQGVPILVYKLPVTQEEMAWIRGTIDEIMADPQFVYNFFSVLTYPVLGGFSTYKAFSCIEFVAYILQHLGYEIEEPLFEYRPDDLKELLKDYLCYDGSLQNYTPVRTASEDYFRPLTMALLLSSAAVGWMLLRRKTPWGQRSRNDAQ